MKQTAVEWLVEKLTEQQFVTQAQIFIAKAMEKEQIIDAYKYAQVLYAMGDTMRAEQYYNETYKK